jgi:hypothetical protein
MTHKWITLIFLVTIAVWIISLQAASCQLGPNWTINQPDWQGDIFETPTPSPIAPTPTAEPTTPTTTTTIGSSLLTNLALFAVLPIAIGATTFFIIIKGTEDKDSGTMDMIAPITIAISAIILTEILVYMAVFVISALD